MHRKDTVGHYCLSLLRSARPLTRGAEVSAMEGSAERDEERDNDSPPAETEFWRDRVPAVWLTDKARSARKKI